MAGFDGVATSRARVATLVVESSELPLAECLRPKQMRIVNALARFSEKAGGRALQPVR